MTLSNPALGNIWFWAAVSIALCCSSLSVYFFSQLRKKRARPQAAQAIPEEEACLSFALIGREVKVTLTPAALLKSPEASLYEKKIWQELGRQGFTQYAIQAEVFTQMVADFKQLKAKKTYVVGTSKDCEIELEIAEDNLTAWLEIRPAQGGQSPTVAMLNQLLQERQVTYGILEEVLEQAVKEQKLERTVVAEGLLPEAGEDSTFELLVDPEETSEGPAVREDGTVDFREGRRILTLEPGQLLMRRLPPTAGQPGSDVKGQAIPAEAGQVLPFGEAPGSAVSPSDPDLLVATREGCAFARENTVAVEKIYIVDEVNMQTGNIHFDGNVLVHGTVRSGFKIEATGDVTVEDVVEAAHISAGGDIHLQAGIVGQDKAILEAGGSIHAHFVEGCKLKAQKNIVVNDLLLQSEAAAGDSILVGQDAPKAKGQEAPKGQDTPQAKGQILGGTIRATVLVKAKILGSSASTPTLLEVGLNPQFSQESQQVQQALQEQRKQLKEVEANIKYAQMKGPEEKMTELQGQKETLEEEIKELTQREEKLSKAMQLNPAAKVTGTAKVFGGVKVRIGDAFRSVTQDSVGGSFTLAGKDVKFGSV